MSLGVHGQGEGLSRAEELNVIDPPTSSKKAEAANNQNDVELSLVLTSKEPDPLKAADAAARKRLESQFSPLQRLAPGLDLTEVQPGIHSRKLEGGTRGVYLIDKGTARVVIKPPDSFGGSSLFGIMSTKMLANLKAVVPKSELIEEEGDAAELRRITSSTPDVKKFIAMEKVEGTALDALREADKGRLLSKDQPFFKEMGYLFSLDHLLSQTPDRLNKDRFNGGNYMLTADHLVAIDNHTDLAQGNGKLTSGLEAFKDVEFLPKALQRLNLPFPAVEGDPFYSNKFKEGVAEGIQTLAATFTRTVDGKKEVNSEKIREFVVKSEVPAKFIDQVVENLERRMVVIIELANDSMYHLEGKEAQGCCIVM